MTLQTIVKELQLSSHMIRSNDVQEFLEKYAQKNAEDIDWVEFCQDVRKYNCPKAGFRLFKKLLDEGLYCGSHAEKLYANLPMYEEMSLRPSKVYDRILCGNKIERQVIYLCREVLKGKETMVYLFNYIETDNRFLVDCCEQYLRSGDTNGRYWPSEIVSVFGKSFGKYEGKIRSISDFTENTLYEQLEFYKSYFSENKKLSRMGLLFVAKFYRWLVRTNPENRFFDNCFHITESFLFNRHFTQFPGNDYYITTFNSENIPYGKEKICFLLKGLENDSTRLMNDDCVSVDLSMLSCRFYRDLLIEFLVMSCRVSLIHNDAYKITKVFKVIYETKQHPDYPNKRLDYLTNEEAVFIRKIIEAQDIKFTTKNNEIGTIRRFIRYCVNKKAIEVDDLFFDYLREYENANINTAKAISDDDLVKLSGYFNEMGKESVIGRELFVIFHLAIQTEFRINQICHLQIDCIKHTLKPNEYEISSISKTSNGRKKRSVITALTYNLLTDVIERTEPIRERCPVESMRKYIFLYDKSSVGNRPVVMDNSIFSKYLSKACEDLHISHYSTSNIRDTYMTKALEHTLRNGKSDMSLSLLTKHKHFDTTKNHYISMRLEKMLEATYGITIGDDLVQSGSRIVESIPEKYIGKENDVENGCGKCTAEYCSLKGPATCKKCESFITTIEHKHYFEKEIEFIDQCIAKATNPHDKEDLMTKKRIDVQYLKAIILLEEDRCEND